VSRTYVCDGNGCGNCMDGPAVTVQYSAIENEDDDDPTDEEAHFCSWVCLSSWATSVALDYPPLQ